MTPENLARHADDPNMEFWLTLKDGYDHFEVTRRVPKVEVCDKRYVFNADAGDAEFVAAEACPAYTIPDEVLLPLMAKQEADAIAFDVALARDGSRGDAHDRSGRTAHTGTVASSR